MKKAYVFTIKEVVGILIDGLIRQGQAKELVNTNYTFSATINEEEFIITIVDYTPIDSLDKSSKL